MMRRITACVANTARRQPNNHAVIDVRESTVCIWSWSKLWREAERIASLLLRLGVSSGDIVAYQLPNRAEFVAITLGILRAGGVCCPLSPLVRERGTVTALSRSGARVLFVADQYRERSYPKELAELEQQLIGLDHVVVVRLGDSKALSVPKTARLSWTKLDRTVSLEPKHQGLDVRRPAGDAMAQLLFMRDRSGTLQGVLHRHDALMTAAMMYAERLELEDTDRIFVPSSLAEQTGFLYGMWTALSLGIPHIVQGTWDPEKALRVLGNWRGTVLQAAPAYLTDMLDALQSGTAPSLFLRAIVPTGPCMEPFSWLPTRVCGAFGTLEGCLVTLAGPKDPLEQATSTAGRALREVRLRIRDDRGQTLASGQQGHLQVQSPTMFAGYLDESNLTAKAYTADGWYQTGYLASIDGEGYLRVTGCVQGSVSPASESIPSAKPGEGAIDDAGNLP